MSKRFKVVQDRYGNWGIHFGPWQEASFASYGKWGDNIQHIVTTAIKLNLGIKSPAALAWTWYEPRPKATK